MPFWRKEMNQKRLKRMSIKYHHNLEIKITLQNMKMESGHALVQITNTEK